MMMMSIFLRTNKDVPVNRKKIKLFALCTLFTNVFINIYLKNRQCGTITRRSLYKRRGRTRSMRVTIVSHVNRAILCTLFIRCIE